MSEYDAYYKMLGWALAIGAGVVLAVVAAVAYWLGRS